MSTFKHHQLVEGPFKDDNPLEQLITFYEVNGYVLTDPYSEDDDDESPRKVCMTRGKKGASFWSSDMTELFAELTLEYLETTMKIDYEVETTMQHFTEDDRGFWIREAANAEKFLTGKVEEAIDWRGNEAARAEQVQRDILSLGIKLGVLAVVVVFVIVMVTT